MKNEIERISELQYIPGYVSQKVHDSLINQIDLQRWLSDLKRRVQHYGYKYDYRARRIDPDMRLGELPNWLGEIAHQIYKDGLLPEVPDQAIVNEYIPPQGIADHVDCEPCFSDTVISLSLGSGVVMNFINLVDKTKIPIWLEPRSIVILTGEARYFWKHGIPGRKSDIHQGERRERTRRISITFRKVILQ
jgi:alkylated DNA repair dioxygenase AlkB